MHASTKHYSVYLIPLITLIQGQQTTNIKQTHKSLLHLHVIVKHLSAAALWQKNSPLPDCKPNAWEDQIEGPKFAATW